MSSQKPNPNPPDNVAVPIRGRRYLVTGGCGFLGSALVKALVHRGALVRVLDNQSRGRWERLEEVKDEVELVEGDIREPGVVLEAARGVDSICHLAFINGTEFFYTKPELVLEVGVKGMVNVLDAAIANKVRDFVLASSSEVYQTPPSTPTDEKVPLVIPDVMNPRYSYAGGKIISELMAVNYADKYFDRVVIFRPHNVYGPDMGWEHVLPQFIVQAAQLKDSVGEDPVFHLQGDGTESRAFIHIDDLTDGLMRLIEFGEHKNIYHIGTENEIAIKDVAKLVLEMMGVPAKIAPGPLLEGGTRRRCPDISKLRKIGFEPAVSLREGLPSMIQWYLANLDRRPQPTPVSELSDSASLATSVTPVTR